MKHISLALCALAGAIMASAGTIAESSATRRSSNDLDGWGLFIAGAFCLFTLISVIRATLREEDNDRQ